MVVGASVLGAAVVGASVVVVIYASLGGLKGVIWADFFQYSIAMFGAVLAAVGYPLSGMLAMSADFAYYAQHEEDMDAVTRVATAGIDLVKGDDRAVLYARTESQREDEPAQLPA